MGRTCIVIYFLAHEVRPDIAGWSSLVARRAHNPEVVGSNPAPATKNFVARKLNGFRAFLLFRVNVFDPILNLSGENLNLYL